MTTNKLLLFLRAIGGTLTLCRDDVSKLAYGVCWFTLILKYIVDVVKEDM